MSGDAIGMMEGAFFVSKGVILEWMNELLDVSVLKSLIISIASTDKNRAVRNRLSLLPDYGCNLPRNFQHLKSQMGS